MTAKELITAVQTAIDCKHLHENSEVYLPDLGQGGLMDFTFEVEEGIVQTYGVLYPIQEGK